MSAMKERELKDADAAAPVIAVVGGSEQTVESLASMVLEEGFRLFSDDSGTEAEGAMATAPDVVVLDVSESDLAGQVEGRLQDCQAKWNVPILCLVSPGAHLKTHVIAKLGADDYVLNPVRSHDLACRVKAILQRWTEPQGTSVVERRRKLRRKDDRQQGQTVRADSRCAIDEAGKTILIEGRALDLSPKEYELLRLLASNPGRTLSAQEIITEVWPDLQRASAADVHQYVHMLRRKVESDPKQPRWIITVRGFGYKLVFPAEE